MNGDTAQIQASMHAGHTIVRYRIILLLILSLLALACTQPVTAQEPAKANILVIHSYHPDMEWVQCEQNGINSALQGQTPIPVDMHIEYMDTKYIEDDRYLQNLADLYAYKYARTSFDAIITCDDPAFQFALAHRAALFPDTPIVFCGVNYFDPNMTAGDPLVTGVVEAMDLRGTLTLAKGLQPSVSTVVVINDQTTTGIANKKQLLENLAGHRETFDIVFLENMTLPEIQEEVSRLPDTAVVLLLTYNQDPTGARYTYEEAIAAIAPASSVPVYSVWEIYLGRGIIGGMILSGEEQGRIAGEIAIRIIQGGDASAIPVVRTVEQHPVLDQKQLDRFGIGDADVPVGSSIINRPPCTVEIPLEIVSGAIGCLIGLLGIILFQKSDIRKRKRIEDRLRESEEKFRGLAQRSFDMIFMLDTEEKFTYASPAAEKIIGYRPEYITGKHSLAFVLPPFRQQMNDAILRVLSGESVTEFQTQMQKIDGKTSYLEIDASPIVKNGVIVGVQGVAHDITIRKEMEQREREAYAQIETNIEQFAILGDHIRNPLQVILALTTFDDSPNTAKIIDQVHQIDEIVTKLDTGCIESENIRQFLRRNYGLEGNSSEHEGEEQPDEPLRFSPPDEQDDFRYFL
jgi:sigma-B regulation protein RsbU (phosphoserine phosphatase)